eukprot:3049668-Prorocentrum_lima.AAC.1
MLTLTMLLSSTSSGLCSRIVSRIRKAASRRGAEVVLEATVMGKIRACGWALPTIVNSFIIRAMAFPSLSSRRAMICGMTSSQVWTEIWLMPSSTSSCTAGTWVLLNHSVKRRR